MTLIMLLFVLVLERVAARSQAWQFQAYFSFWTSSDTFRSSSKTTSSIFWVWLLTPAIVLWLMLTVSSSHIVSFIVETCVLLLCIGDASLRKHYKGYLNAASRGDAQACYQYAQLLGCQLNNDCQGADTDSLENETSESKAPESMNNEQEVAKQMSMALIWINFRYYGAVMFWFVIAGASGALLYCSLREVYTRFAVDTPSIKAKLAPVLHVLEWLPARFISFGFLVVGSFSAGFSTWLSYLLMPTISAKEVIEGVARKAEDSQCTECNFIAEPSCMVKFGKRNITLFLCVVALLTLFVGLR